MIRILVIVAVALLSAAFLPRGVVSVVGVPTLSAQSSLADGFDHVLPSVTTDVASGTLYQSTSTNCGLSPTAAQVKAGVTSAVSTTNQGVAASGVQSMNPSGMSAVTPYCTYFVHTSAGGDSNVVKTASVTTGGTLTITALDDAVCSPTWNSNGNVAAWNLVRSSVINFWQSMLSPSVNTTVTVTFGFTVVPTPGTCSSAGGGAASSWNVFTGYSYNTATTGVRDKFKGMANQSSNQRSAYTALPTNDPTGVSNSYGLTDGVAFATGIRSSFVGNNAGIGISNNAWTTSPSDGTSCSNGDIPLWQLISHEMTEVLGRESSIVNSLAVPSTMDMFTWSATNTRNVTTSGNRYPSADGAASFYGTTNGFLQSGSCNAGAGDCGDLTNSGAFPGSSFRANVQACPPAFNPPNVGDLLLMNILGWGLSHDGRIAAGL